MFGAKSGDPGRAGRKQGGYLTVYLTMMIAALLPLILTLTEGARSGAIRLESEIAMDVAMNSCFAEYHRELFNRYHLLAIDSSYGSNQASTSRTAQHLKSYLSGNLETDDGWLSGLFYRDFLGLRVEEVTIDGAVFLTDHEGELFRRRAAETIKYDTGIAEIQELIALFEHAENDGTINGVVSERLEGMAATLDPDKPIIQEILELGGSGGNASQGALAGLFPGRKSLGLLTNLIDDEENLSQREIVPEDLAGARVKGEKVSQGNMRPAEANKAEEALEGFLFLLYLQRNFSSYTDPEQGDALAYQLEYLASGRASDVENLKKVLQKLVLLRSSLDFACLQTDAEKAGQAELIGTAIATALLIPEAKDAFREILMLIWAYAEGSRDVRTLLEGGAVPFTKSADDWYYDDLWNLIAGSGGRTANTGDGLNYEQYLLGLIFLTGEKNRTLRAMDLIEAEIRKTPGNGAFRLDACIDTLKATGTVESIYGYHLAIERTMDYQ